MTAELEGLPVRDRQPYKRGRLPDSKDRLEMELPEGKTCADCIHTRRCCLIFGHIPADEVCDWHPSRYTPRTNP